MDQVYEIFDYLPVNKQPPEAEYIGHLYDTLTVLEASNNSAISFILMPFHLLFMLSLQYKILRICSCYEKHVKLVFSTSAGRIKAKLLDSKRSVFDIALLHERMIPEIFQLIDVDEKIILKMKDLVDYRNDYLGHAKGGINQNPGEKIEEYLEVLRKLQKYMLELNDKVAEKWLSEMEPGEAGVEYMDLHLAEEYLCPADMQQGKLVELDKRLNGEI